ncbi:transposase [Pelagicoccus sp. SDUM812002]|uniref:transposase n=1 Tax=Pelagicoccus sp. SDUM812002 TaxID=3041266 RepID=UPI0034E2BA7F
MAVIPPRRNRKRKIEYIKEVGKTRHRVENFFAKIKRYRRIGTRYDKLEKTYMGFVNIAALVDWVKFDFVHAA